VAEGMVLNISLGVVTPPGTTAAYSTSVEINGIPVITCNGAKGNTSGMDGGDGATLRHVSFAHIPHLRTKWHCLSTSSLFVNFIFNLFAQHPYLFCLIFALWLPLLNVLRF